MHSDTLNMKSSRTHANGLSVAAVCFVLFIASAIAGRAELFGTNANWLNASWIALLIPVTVLACFAVAWVIIRRSDVRLLDAISLETMITLSQGGLYCHVTELMIPWSLVEDVHVERKLQRRYEVLADLHLRLKKPVLGKTVYTFDVARLCVPSKRVLELVSHRVRVNSGNRPIFGDDAQGAESQTVASSR